MDRYSGYRLAQAVQLGLPTCSDTVIISNVSSNNYPVVTGIAHSKYVKLTSSYSPSLRLTTTAQLYVSSVGGTCLGTPTDHGNTLTSSLNIQGPEYACTGDTIVWKVINSSGTMFSWEFPNNWNMVAQNGDSIVLIPDTSNGYLKVTVCNNNCECAEDSIMVSADSCYTFCITLGDQYNDVGTDVMEASDGTFVIGGYVHMGPTGKDFYLAKLSRKGTLIWTKRYDIGSYDYAFAISENKITGSYIMTGYAKDGVNPDDAIVINTDTSGNIRWAKKVGGNTYDGGKSIAIDHKGNMVVGGFSSFGAGGYDAYIFQLDTNGNLLWTKMIGEAGNDQIMSVTCHSNIIIAVGFIDTAGVGSGKEDFLIVALDSLGNILWKRTFKGINGERARSVIRTSEGGFVIVGSTSSFGLGGNDMMVIKIDSTGNLLWAKAIGGAGDDIAEDVALTMNGDLIIVGETASYGAGQWDAYVVKLSGSGNLLWAKTIGGPNYDDLKAITSSKDGHFVAVGQTASFGFGGGFTDIYILKFDQDGNFVSCPNGCQSSTGGFIVDITPQISSKGQTSTGGIAQNISPTTLSGGQITRLCP